MTHEVLNEATAREMVRRVLIKSITTELEKMSLGMLISVALDTGAIASDAGNELYGRYYREEERP